MLRSLVCGFLLLSSTGPLLAQTSSAARLRLTLQNPQRVVIGTLVHTTSDSIYLWVRDSGRMESLALSRTLVQRTEVSAGRRTSTILPAALVGGLGGLTYVLAGHPGLPHLGGESWGGIIAELVAFSLPFAALTGTFARIVAPELWVESTLPDRP